MYELENHSGEQPARINTNSPISTSSVCYIVDMMNDAHNKVIIGQLN